MLIHEAWRSEHFSKSSYPKESRDESAGVERRAERGTHSLRCSLALVRLLAEAFGNSNELVSGGLELLNSVWENLMSSGLISLVVESQNSVRVLRDNLVVDSLALSDRGTDGIARATEEKNDQRLDRTEK